MHPGELALDEAVVRRLVDTQLPQWAVLPLERVGSSGTVNVLYRHGDELVVRLPRVFEGGKVWSRGAFDRDREWLPQLAPLLPAVVPEPLAKGEPGEGYPRDWAVVRVAPGRAP